MIIEDDILDLIRGLPSEINDMSTTTELKFLTIGGVLMECYDEIQRLRSEVERLKGRSKVRKRR